MSTNYYGNLNGHTDSTVGKGYANELPQGFSDHARNNSQHSFNVYDGFSQVNDPKQYLNAPSRIIVDQSNNHQLPPLPDGHPQAQNQLQRNGDFMNQNRSEYFHLSPDLNTSDQVSMHFLVQSSMAFAKDSKIFSYDELIALQKESQMLTSRVADLNHQIMMEVKLRDAAYSLMQLHSPETSPNLDRTSGTKRPSFMGTLSNGISREKKRASKSAGDEVEQSNRKIVALQSDVAKNTERLIDVNDRIYKHHIGLLALTHDISKSSSDSNGQVDFFKNYDTSFGTAFSDEFPELTEAEANAGKTQPKDRQESQKQPAFYPRINSLVDSLIETMTATLQSPASSSNVTESTDPEAKLDLLSYLTSSVAESYNINKMELHNAESTLESLKTGIVKELEIPYRECSPSTVQQRLKKDREVHERIVSELKELQNKHQDMLNGSGTATGSRDEAKVKAMLQQQLAAVSEAYEINRGELEKMELENMQLKNDSRESAFRAQSEITELKNELSVSSERVTEWKERCDSLRKELESVVGSLEDLTRQTVDYETERQKLEGRVKELQDELFEIKKKKIDNRVSSIATHIPPSPPSSDENDFNHGQLASTAASKKPQSNKESLSVTILRHEFRQIVLDLNSKHEAELRKEEAAKRKLENLLRHVKTSSYAAALPPGKLEKLLASVPEVAEDS